MTIKTRTPILLFILTFGWSVLFVSCGGNTTESESVSNTEVPSSDPQPELITENAVEETAEATETTTNTETKEEKTVAASEKSTNKQPKPTKEKTKTNKQPDLPKEMKTVKEVIKTTAQKVEEKVEKPVEKVKETVKKPIEKVKEVIKKPIKKAEEKKETTPTKTPPPPPVTTPKKPTLSHDKWNQLTGKFISSSGKVNYAGIKSNKKLLDDYIHVLENNPPQSSWGNKKIIAYWINAYNAFTIKLIADNYPVGSITDLDGGNPWKKKRIKIGNSTYSLDQIEKEILIKQYKEPRVHFAVNCAAKSCPPIINKAWTASNLEANLEKSTRNFINNTAFNDVSSAKNIKLSKIFDWYASDFGDVISFINKYAAKPVKSNAKISYNEYDWALNN